MLKESNRLQHRHIIIDHCRRNIIIPIDNHTMNTDFGFSDKQVEVRPHDTYPHSRMGTSICSYCSCGHLAKVLGNHNKYDWALFCRCAKPTCNNEWFWCNRCRDSGVKGRLARKGLAQHRLRRHSPCTKKRKAHPPSATEEVNKNTDDNTAELQNTMEESMHDVDQAEDGFDAAMHVDDVRDFNFSDDGGERETHDTGPFKDSDYVAWTTVKDGSDLGFTDVASKNFFHAASSSVPGCNTMLAGTAYIVKQSILQRKLHPADAVTMLTPDKHVLFTLDLTRLLATATSGSYDMIAEVCAGAYDIGHEDGYFCATSNIDEYVIQNDTMDGVVKPYQELRVREGSHRFGISVCRSRKDFNARILDNKYGVYNNIPHPQVQTDLKHHAYVSIIDHIRHAVGIGRAMIGTIDHHLQVVPGRSLDHPSRTPRAKQILENAKQTYGGDISDVLVSYFKLWHDDFDGAAACGLGIQQLWILTISIACPQANGNLLTNTFPVAIGPKAASHDEVWQRVAEDLKILKSPAISPYYSGRNNKQCHLFFDMFAGLADQLERRDFNYLSYGNGRFAARWLVSGDHFGVYPALASCDVCQQLLRRRFTEGEWELAVPKCDNCLNWDILQDSPLACVPAPDNYPTEDPMQRLVVCGEKPMLKPFRLNYDGLKKAVSVAHEGYVMQEWGEGTLRDVLRVEVMNKKIIDRVLKHARYAKGLAVATGATLEELQQVQQKQPELFEKMPYPAQWLRSNTELETYIDVIMHLLFLGIVKAVACLIQDSLCRRHQNAPFIRENKQYVEVFKLFRIDWLKILEYKGAGFGGWKSENWLGFSRIMPWFYQNISEVIPEQPEPLDFPASQAKWVAKHNRHWLRERGLKTSGDAALLASRVAKEMKKIPIPEPLPIPDTITEADVECLVTSLGALLQCVMAKEVNDEVLNKTEYAARIFLSAYDNLEKKLRKGTCKPGVISCYNFMSLLNLSETMKMFGPLRFLWEGKWQGEAFIQRVKALMTHGLRGDNCEVNLLRRLVRGTSLDNIYRSVKPETAVKRSFLADNSGDLYRYRTPQELVYAMDEMDREKKTPIPVVLVHCNSSGIDKIYAVVNNYETVAEILLLTTADGEDRSVAKMGFQYYKFGLKQSLVVPWQKEMEKLESPKIGFGMLLPLHDKANDEEGRRFALISSNHGNHDNGIASLID